MPSAEMKQAQRLFDVSTHGKGLREITHDIARWVEHETLGTGLLTLFCRHTSASLLIQENAAAEVRSDIIDWLDRIAPEDGGWRHDSEGPDDMPAHLKAALTGTSLSIPIADGRMVLGTWQGVFLAEHRTSPHRRQVVAHYVGT